MEEEQAARVTRACTSPSESSDQHGALALQHQAHEASTTPKMKHSGSTRWLKEPGHDSQAMADRTGPQGSLPKRKHGQACNAGTLPCAWCSSGLSCGQERQWAAASPLRKEALRDLHTWPPKPTSPVLRRQHRVMTQQGPRGSTSEPLGLEVAAGLRGEELRGQTLRPPAPMSNCALLVTLQYDRL